MTQYEIPIAVRAKVVAAAQAIYRITGIPDFDAALKFALRKKATEILSGIAGSSLLPASRQTEHQESMRAACDTVCELVQFGETLGLISKENANKVAQAYREIALQTVARESGKESLPSSSNMGEESEEETSVTPELSSRQQRLVEHINRVGKAQIGELYAIFGYECSEKTLQRDLAYLANFGIILKFGDNRWTFYTRKAE